LKTPGRILVLVTLIIASCDSRIGSDDFMLEEISSGYSSVNFANNLKEDETINIVEYLYFYNGGGVAIGDLNKDGLEDIVFSSSQEQPALYINEGDFKFKDITPESGITLSGNWHTGVNIADINQDGFPDIFFCGVGGYKNLKSYNQVFINNGDLTFTDKTSELGLNFQGLSTHTSFLDFDQDGDLDLYLLNHSVHSVRSIGSIGLRNETDSRSGDILYENRLVPDGNVHFVPVAENTGLFSSALGYGLGVAAGDLNMDGRTDLYISNDFYENDYLYLNAGDGKFTESVEKSMSHTSRFSMGNTIADINNDLLPDLISLDMLPWKEDVIKTSAGEDPFDVFEYKKKFGYHYQFARNTLQLNTGIGPDGVPRFSDIAPLACIDATDWSWSPLAADWDNDGWKDIFISNGIVRRPNDMDYISFISSDSAKQNASLKSYLNQMPSGAVPNAIFKNNGNLSFSNMSGNWFNENPGVSNGAAYADLDNDGDLDLILNNINEKAGLFRNNQTNNNGFSIELEGTKPNIEAYGSKIFVYTNGVSQYRELQPSSGFESSVSRRLHFGTGTALQPDSVLIVWPDGSEQRVVISEKTKSPVLSVKKENTTVSKKVFPGKSISKPKFQLTFEGPAHNENIYTGFQNERLLPHSMDSPGPALAIADVDGDGNPDLYRSGTSAGSGYWHTNFGNGKFNVTKEKKTEVFQADESAVRIFDANGDSHPDMLILYGGQQPLIPTSYFPQLLLNDGKGNFKNADGYLPTIALNGSVIAEQDIDRDGDMDIFLGGDLAPANYGLTPYSYLLINDGKGRFSNQTTGMFPGSGGKLGMISDAAWCDLNKDTWPDLIVAGEWMSVQVWINQKGSGFLNESEKWNLNNTGGIWHSISCGDFDSDGDTDLIAGNHGLNSRLRADEQNPIKLYITDLDNNSSIDQLLEYRNNGKPSPFWTRDQLTRQVPSLKKHFLRYSDYKEITTEEILRLAGKTNPEYRTVHMLASTYFENTGGKFTARPLPEEAQFAPVFAICPADLNNDRFTDFLIGGNLFPVTPELGRMNASRGLILYGKENGSFEAVNGVNSGFLIEGECRSLNLISEKNNTLFFAAGMNNGPLKVFRYDRPDQRNSPSPEKPN
jgi:hypothetical protein